MAESENPPAGVEGEQGTRGGEDQGPARCPGARSSAIAQLPEPRGCALGVSPLHREVLRDLRWAQAEYARGAFDDRLGQYVAVVGEKPRAFGCDVNDVLDRAARDAGVPLERVALFHLPVAD